MFFIIQLVYILSVLVSPLTLGSLQSYYTVDDVKTLLDELLKNHTEWFSKEPGDFYTITSDQIMKKTKILVLGGFSGGFPQGNFQILYTIQRLLEMLYYQQDIQDLFGGVAVTFSVFPNELAYIKSIVVDNDSKNVEFNEIYGDQVDYLNSCDSIYDIGINPDMNFPINFVESGDYCYANFSGNSFRESEITEKFALVTDKYNAVINYQGSGNYYASPHAGVSIVSELDSIKLFINQVLIKAGEAGFKTGSLYEINGELINGTYMDFVHYKNNPFIQIALGKYGKLTSKDDLLIDAQVHFDIFLNQIVSVLAEPKINYLKSIEKQNDCSNLCNYSYDVNVSLIITNLGIFKRYFGLEVIFNFSNETNYCAQSGVIEFKDLATQNVYNDSLIVEGNNRVIYNERPIDDGCEATVTINFKKFIGDKKDKFNITYKLFPLMDFDYFRTDETSLFELEFDYDSESSDESYDEYAGIYAISLGVSFSLALLSGMIALFCICKHKMR